MKRDAEAAEQSAASLFERNEKLCGFPFRQDPVPGTFPK